MKILGLCGGSGSGKGSVCKYFALYGIPSIDTDAIYHKITSAPSPCVLRLCERFGEEILNEAGGLNRRALAKVVFSDGTGQSAKELNTITHGFVLDEVRKIIASYAAKGVRAVIVDAPMLFESGFDRECHKIICVTADTNIRIARILLRDGISYEDAQRRIRAQLSDEELRARCDYNIVNEGSLEDLESQVCDIINQIN